MIIALRSFAFSHTIIGSFEVLQRNVGAEKLQIGDRLIGNEVKDAHQRNGPVTL